MDLRMGAFECASKIDRRVAFAHTLEQRRVIIISVTETTRALLPGAVVKAPLRPLELRPSR